MCFNNYQNTYTGSSSVIFLLQTNQTPLEGKGGSQDGQERDAEWRGSTEQLFCGIVAETGQTCVGTWEHTKQRVQQKTKQTGLQKINASELVCLAMIDALSTCCT